MRRVSPLLFHQPAKGVDAASNEFGSILILLSGLTEAIGIHGLLVAIRLDAVDDLSQ